MKQNNPERVYRAYNRIPKLAGENRPPLFKIEKGKELWKRTSSPVATKNVKYVKATGPCIIEALSFVSDQGAVGRCFYLSEEYDPVTSKETLSELGDGECTRLAKKQKKQSFSEKVKGLVKRLSTCSADGDCRPADESPCLDECKCGLHRINECLCVRPVGKSRPCSSYKRL